jgi:hypothetical protein
VPMFFACAVVAVNCYYYSAIMSEFLRVNASVVSLKH